MVGIKTKIKKIIVLLSVAFVGLQAILIFSPSSGIIDAFEYTETAIKSQNQTNLFAGSETENQAQSNFYQDILVPINEISNGTESQEQEQEWEGVAKDEKNEESESEQQQETEEIKAPESNYFLHKDIVVTYFWVGEKESDDNGDISNVPSAWDEDWTKHFGGEDTPKKRNGYFPAKFTPKENPFYFALPYNDFNDKGDRRSSAKEVIPWAVSKKWKSSESMCKNQWIKVVKNGKAVYAQWEDVGPFEENDSAYVFGTAKPKNKEGSKAGLDVSPAVRDYLDLSDVDKVDWQFIDAVDVPNGPWKQIITSSQVNWK